MEVKMVKFQKYDDNRGSLVVAEYEKEIPFLVKRIYYIYGVGEGIKRGFHSHKALEQLYVAINGSCKVTLTDGKETKTILLDKPDEGLYIGHNIWREIFDFSKEAILLVFASEKYSEDDYIRKFDEFNPRN